MLRLLVLMLSFNTLLGCRTTQRPTVTSEDPIAVTLRLHGVDAETITKYKLTAQLKLCFEASGKQLTSTTYVFMVEGVHRDTICQVRLVGPPSNESNVNFFSGTSDGVYFDAVSVVLTLNPDGGLGGDAFLQKHFSEKTGITPAAIYKVHAALVSEKTLSSSCTCRLTCEPTLVNDAAIVTPEAGTKNASCQFDNLVRKERDRHECNQLFVQCGPELFASSISPAAVIAAGPGVTTNIGPLTLNPAQVTPEGDVIIIPRINR
jgi:hypothetical protein